MNNAFRIAPPSTAALNTMRILTMFVAGLCAVPVIIAPVPVKWPLALVDLLAVGMIVRVTLRMETVTFTVTGDRLEILGDLSNRSMLRRTLDVAAAKRLTPEEYHAARPTLKLGGVGAPGYLSGWFMLASGEKAYIYVTDKTKVVRIPTTDGYTLLLTPDDPDGFLRALRS